MTRLGRRLAHKKTLTEARIIKHNRLSRRGLEELRRIRHDETARAVTLPPEELEEWVAARKEAGTQARGFIYID